MEIKILGKNDEAQNALYRITKQAVEELGLGNIAIMKENITTLPYYDILHLPTLIINGKLVSTYKKLNLEEIKSILLQQ
ncbi:MAG: thioredoxin family protein [Ignavibacteria bacterium]|jgi:hypothetical protein|nr:thioredoxin family protein [Ignavibacteria bacterium]